MGFLDRFRRAAPDTAPPVIYTASEDATALVELAKSGASLEAQRDALADYLGRRRVSPPTVDAVLAQTRDGIALFESPGADRRSRLGGDGLLPPGEEWPRNRDGKPLTFIAALDFAELPHLDPLPREGTLLVYWDEQFFEVEPMDFVAATRVLHTPAAAELEEHAPPEGSSTMDAIPLRGFRMPLPGSMAVDASDADESELHDAAHDLGLALCHQLLGTSRDVQGPAVDEVSYWFGGHVLPETRERFSEAERTGEGWTLLAQFEETEGLLFGDAGALYLVMPDADLRTGRFDRVMGIMQSG